jgi:hypothetical protein
MRRKALPVLHTEIVLFNVNEVIGRSYIGTVDAGDTIFVHMFGAYFGLAASRYLLRHRSLQVPTSASQPPGTYFGLTASRYYFGLAASR